MKTIGNRAALLILGFGLCNASTAMAAQRAGESTDQWLIRAQAELAEAEAAARAARRAELEAELAALDAEEGQAAPVASASPAPPAQQPIVKNGGQEPEEAADGDDSPAPPNGNGDDFGNFLGLNFGIGLSLTLDNGDNDRITAAELDPNGIVRVTDEDNDIARVMLEAHYFFTPDFPWIDDDEGRWGWGPFVAVQPGDGEIIDAIAGGVMFGWRYDGDTGQSFNLGFGYVVDPNTRILGDGIVANQPLPEGETEIRFRETSQHGWLVLASFGF